MSEPKKTIKSLHTASIEAYNYQLDIKSGVIVPTDMGFNFMNQNLLGGGNKSDIITVAGLSSTGKSTLINQSSMAIATLNANCRVLFMSYEVPGRKLASKHISRRLNMSLREMYDKDTTIDKKEYEVFKNIPIDIVEIPLNIEVISKVIYKYCNKFHNDRVHVIFDHTLLIDNMKGDNDMETLINVANYCNKVKKDYNIIFILVSQLNDSMLKPERLRNPAGHYPNQTDIFGSRAVYHVSDCVMVSVMPTRLNIPKVRGKCTYGTHELPLHLKIKGIDEPKNVVYIHSIKTRDSNPRIDPLLDNLKYSDLQELSTKGRESFKIKYKI